MAWTYATWPLVTLTLDREYVRLSVLGRLSGPIWIARDEVIEVAVRRDGLGSSIWFASESGHFDGVSYRSFDPLRVLAAFAAAGWPVSGPPSAVRPDPG